MATPLLVRHDMPHAENICHMLQCVQPGIVYIIYGIILNIGQCIILNKQIPGPIYNDRWLFIKSAFKISPKIGAMAPIFNRLRLFKFDQQPIQISKKREREWVTCALCEQRRCLYLCVCARSAESESQPVKTQKQNQVEAGPEWIESELCRAMFLYTAELQNVLELNRIKILNKEIK